MGQRSQIYVRWNLKNGKKMFVPRYYSWNYGTRMISRARGIVEWLENNGKFMGTPWYENEEKLRRIMDTNFDYKDVVLGVDLIKEWESYEQSEDFNNVVFYGQDNNDGQLFIDMIVEYSDTLKEEKLKFKYVFLESSDGEKPMTGNEYMQWDECCEENKSWEENPYIQKEIRYTKRNIAWLEKHAELMTEDEIKEFREYPYIIDIMALRKEN